MSILKKALLCFLIVVVLAIILAYFLPNHWFAQREITIERPPSAVFPYIADLRQWQHWATWYQEKNPDNEIRYEGPESGVGAHTFWEGPKIGKGDLLITRADEQSGIDYDLYFSDHDVKSNGTIALRQDNGNTMVTWSASGELGVNPFMRYLGLFMDSMIGHDFEQGLKNLKTLVEKTTDANP